MATGPLDGVRVLELTQIIAGPLGCVLLADMGAEVIKVEPLEGEPWRMQTQFMPHESKPYQALNRGKRSLSLNLQSPEGQEIIHRLVPSMDVVVSNYRPDVPKRLNMDYEALSAIKPDLIYVVSTAFGNKGPWANRGGYDIVVQGASGFTGAAGRFDANGNPEVGSNTAIADQATGYSIALGTCAALYYRAMTGKGQLVETSLLANALQVQASTVMSLPPADASVRTPFLEYLREAKASGASYTEMVAKRTTLLQGQRPGHIYYRNYLTSNGAITVGALSKSLRQKVRDALGIDYDPRDDDPDWNPAAPESVAFGAQLVERAERQIRELPTEHWIELFERHGVPVAELLFPEQMAEEEQVLANDYIVELEHELSGPQLMAAPPHKMSLSPPTPQGASPPLGRHNDEILQALGYSAEDIAGLRAGGFVR